MNELEGVIRIDESEIRSHVDDVVRRSVEQTLNGLLEAEPEQFFRAKRYRRAVDRVDTLARHCKRTLHTKAGEVELKMLRIRRMRLETEIIGCYQRRESNVEEAFMETYLAGASCGGYHGTLWGTRVSPSTVSELNKKPYGEIEMWLAQPIEREHAYVYLDGIWLKRTWGNEVKNVSVLVAVGVERDDYRQVLGVREVAKEGKESWRGFLRDLKARGLQGVRPFVSDKCLGLIETLAEFYPDAAWQRCMVYRYHNVLTAIPKGKAKLVAAMLKAIYVQEAPETARRKAADVVVKWRLCNFQRPRRSRETASARAHVHAVPVGALETDSHEQSVGANHA